MKKANFIVILLLCILASVDMEAQKNPFGNGLYWELSASGVLTISGNGKMPNFEDKKSPFSEMIDQGKVSKIVIGEGITSVGDNAFSLSSYSFEVSYENRKKVKEVILPSTLERIGKSAFYALYKLKHITLGNRVKVIGDWAFYSGDLTELKIPSSVQSIGRWAFDGNSIRNLNLPGTISSIGKEAFYDNSIEVLSVSDKIESIGENAFKNASRYFNGGILSLPAYINSTNCTYYGISEEAFMLYRNNIGDEKIRSIWLDGGYSNVVAMKNGNSKCYKVRKDGRYGLTDAEGRLIVPTELEALEDAEMGYLKFKLNGFWGLMDYTGKIIIDTSRGYTSIGKFISFTKRIPYTMTGYKGECDLTGKEISRIRVETPQQSTASSSSSSSSSNSNGNSGNNSTTVVVEHRRDPTPVQEWQQCFACYGSGRCSYVKCGGSGWYYIGDRRSTCSTCHGSGKCTTCAGRGGQNVTVYR